MASFLGIPIITGPQRRVPIAAQDRAPWNVCLAGSRKTATWAFLPEVPAGPGLPVYSPLLRTSPSLTRRPSHSCPSGPSLSPHLRKAPPFHLKGGQAQSPTTPTHSHTRNSGHHSPVRHLLSIRHKKWETSINGRDSLLSKRPTICSLPSAPGF